ncbi:MAG: alkyl hydroperoxide reductase subunit F [Bacteroidales bacterium]
MLDQSLKDQVRSVFSSLKNNYSFIIKCSISHPSKNEMVDLLTDVAACSDKIDVKIIESDGFSLEILKNGEQTSIIFRAVPNGHEFTSLLLAVLNLDGIGKNLPDEIIISRIKTLKGKIEVMSYISLTCTNCPDVVQSLNLISIYNPNVTHQIIDGSINQEEVDKLNIQAVPTVYVNDQLLHVGRSTLGELLSKIEQQTGSEYKPTEKQTKNYDVVVAGGGPAGVSSAIYSARKGLKVAIVAEKMGGQLTETLSIENMISIPQTTGNHLTASLKQHLGNYQVDVLENRLIEKTWIENGEKVLQTSMGEELRTKALIIGTGANWRKLNVPGESKYIGAGVAFCAHCDGPFYKNKKVVVVGGGNSGLEAAIDLSALATDVTVLEYLDELKGDQVLQEKLKSAPNVKIITGAETLSVEGDGSKVNGLVFKHRNTGQTENITTDGVFVQIGLRANSQVFAGLVETNKFGEIVVDAHCRTNVPGIYAAGDVTVVPFKQIVIAMGEGAKAALTAFEDRIKGKLS